MNTRVIEYTKCMKCGKEQGYIRRDTNINPKVTDADIHTIIANAEVYTKQWCDKCRMQTLQMRVAWDTGEEEE